MGEAFVGTGGSLTRLSVEFKKVARREFRPAARLAKRVEEIERGPEPLGNFLRFACQFTASPITVRPEALRASSITMQTPVQVTLKKVSMGEVLAKPLKDLNLHYRVTDNDIIVEHVSSLKEADEAFELDLAPLVASGFDLNALANAMKMALGVNRSEKQPAQEFPERLSLRASRIAIGRARSLQSRLCSSRGMAMPNTEVPHSSPFAHLGLEAEAMLTRPVFLAGSKQRPLAGLLLELERQADGFFLIDWPSLREAGLAENSPVRTQGERMPLYAFLEQLLPPMELAYRIEGGSVLQITSRARELECHDIEMYWAGQTSQEIEATGRIAEPIRWDQLLSRMATEFSRANLPLPGQESFEALDVDGQCWVAKLPQSQHRLVARALYSPESSHSVSLSRISMKLALSSF